MKITSVTLCDKVSAIIINERWYMYLDGAWEVYDTLSSDSDIPSVIFHLRDIIKQITENSTNTED